MNNKKTLVIGASPNPLRYSHKAIKKLSEHNIPVEAIGKRETQIGDVKVVVEKKPFENIHTVTLYVNPGNQQEYVDYILELMPKRIIFNPGTHHTDFEEKAKNKGIEAVYDCTLVMLNRNTY